LHEYPQVNRDIIDHLTHLKQEAHTFRHMALTRRHRWIIRTRF